MPNHFELFNHFLTMHVEMSAEDLAVFNAKCEIVEFPKGEIIMKAIELYEVYK